MYLKFHFGFHRKLFYSVITVFVALMLFFSWYQYHREKQYKESLMNMRLLTYNDDLNALLQDHFSMDSLRIVEPYRVTIFDFSGNVLFDSKGTEIAKTVNHIDRQEVKDALQRGTGYDVRRHSKITDETYFYAAKKYDNYIIRSALSYDISLINSLKADATFIWITLIIIVLLGIVFYQVTQRLGKNIRQLNDFAMRADRDEVLEETIKFPLNELGEISQHIVQIYNRLMTTKKALEKEKDLVAQHQDEQARIKRQLTQNIAHELKTPVSSIQGYLETIINNKDLPEAQKDAFIERCFQQSTRLAALLHDISNLTRLDEASELIEIEKVNVSEIISNVLKDVALNLNEKQMTVKSNTSDKHIEIIGNQSLIYSIFRNLMDNAIAYSGENVEVVIDCYQEDDQNYYFDFSDNGVGVGEEHLSRIFERFYRVDKGRSRKMGGTGLGLAVVKNAVIFHGGSITAKKAFGGGLEFVFTLSKKNR
ncbi:MAG: ATP-binding protein [Bacteroidales bacterium]|nr:ATP-binding protein [Bacteroidales bacterium]